MHPLFKLREQSTPELIQLLNSVTLGTNGAHYQHLDTTIRIHELDHPLFLSIERNGKVLGNITFCRRGENWYIRYFAFSPSKQSSGKLRSKANNDNLLKKELRNFFTKLFEGSPETPPVENFYAYIDPKNQRSLWMSENFGFEIVATIATQTFSRIRPRSSIRISKIDDPSILFPLVEKNFSNFTYYFKQQANKGHYYALKDEHGNIIAFAKINTANWRIHRLPGKMGGLLTRLIPYIPGLNKLICPKRHSFIVPDDVWVKNYDPEVLSELFEGILEKESKNLIIWWTDENNPIYKQVKKDVSWGLLNKLIGVSTANLVVKKNPDRKDPDTNPFPYYVSGFDFI